MVDEAADKYAKKKDDADSAVQEMKAYDEKFYGQLADIGEFKSKNMKITKAVLARAGGKYISMRQSDNHFWRPRQKLYTKDFLKRFPHLVTDN